MTNVKQIQQMIPIITCEIPLVKMSASWFLVSMYLIWILESRLIRSNNQSRATLWVLETCLIVGLLPLMIILITASLSSKIKKHGFEVRRFCACDSVVHMRQFICLSVTVFPRFGTGVGVLALSLISRWVSPCRNVDLISRRVLHAGTSKEKCNPPITKSQRSTQRTSGLLTTRKHHNFTLNFVRTIHACVNKTVTNVLTQITQP